MVLGAAGVGAVAAVVCWGCYAMLPRAEAAPPAPAAAAPEPPAPAAPEPSDYTRRVVAYIHGNVPVTREQLGEYLIARMGADRVNHLVNKLIIEKACAEKGVTVTDAEVDALLAEDLSSLRVNKKEFIEHVLRQKRTTLYEWREDVLRPKLLMTKLLREKVTVKEDDLRRAFESLYGEKVRCQAIVWPKEKQQEAYDVYETIRDKPEEFDRLARVQNPGRLAAVGGLMEPFARHGFGDEEFERAAFKLREGEVSGVMRTPATGDNYTVVVLKLVQRIPPDATKKFEEVRPLLEKEVIDRQIQAAVPAECERLRNEAAPKFVLKPSHEARGPAQPITEQLGRSQEAVAYIHGNVPITREQLGEYLIVRYGAEKLDLLVNRLIIERACAERGIGVSHEEVRAATKERLAALQVPDEKTFEEKVLRPRQKSLYEWKEDALRQELLMSKLIRDGVRVEEEDVKQAFEAWHGEKLQCQLILWPRTPRDHQIALKQYDLIRKSAEEFDRAARTQANPRLAAAAGRIDPFGRHSTGNEQLEAEAFKLREGEITPIIETPEGYTVMKLLHKLPAESGVTVEAVRAKLEKEIVQKKTLAQIPLAFQKLREAAAPNFILRAATREEELTREVRQELSEANGGGVKR
jgi:parvulin-like peptidyl-prolyl isomerase